MVEPERRLSMNDYEAISVILKATVHGASLSQISERVEYLMDRQEELSACLDYLVRTQLIRFDGINGTYKISTRGELFLDLNAQLEDAIGSGPEDDGEQRFR